MSTDSGATPSPPAPPRAPNASACERHRNTIADVWRLGCNAIAIWPDLVDDRRFPGRYASVKRAVTKLRAHAPPDARVVITTVPGEEGHALTTTANGPRLAQR